MGLLLEVFQSAAPLASQYFGPEYVQIIFSHFLKKHQARETDTIRIWAILKKSILAQIDQNTKFAKIAKLFFCKVEKI